MSSKVVWPSAVELSPVAPDGLAFQGRQCWLNARTLAPRMAGADDAPLAFGPVASHPGRIGGVDGTTMSQVAIFCGCKIVRELFRSADGTLAAVRMSLSNQTAQAIELHALVPICAQGPESLIAAGVGLADWRVVRMSRQKNDVPGNFRPAVADGDYEHAKVDGAEFKAGLGVQADDLAAASKNPTTVQAEPFVWIRDGQDESRPGMFVGVLGQTEHLSQILMTSNDDRQQLKSFAVRCEFDGALVAPAATRSTHWILLWEDVDEEAMRRRYAELLATVMDVPIPPPAPSIFCSWYFYGTDFTQADLEENLQELKRRPIPFDVLLIDNGWMDDFGSYNSNDRFPGGMKHAADLIRQAGYRPGIWTCPFVIMQDSPALKKFPNLIARDVTGEPVTFPYEKTRTWVVDPTSPDAEAYFAELFGKLKSWGYTVHKFDFLRSIVNAPHLRFHDRSMTRAQAYRHGMAMIRRLAGPDAYILACGGLFEGSAGLVDGIRVGADTKGRWSDPGGATAYQRMGYVVRIKQNIFRSHTSRLWHTDPDALQLRRRTEPFRGRPEFFHLCEGSFTDDEALTLVANHYLGGSIVCLCERMVELPDDRYSLLRRVLPTVTPPARVLDFGASMCPTMFWTQVTPKAKSLQPWSTLVVCNWSDEPVEREVRLDQVPGLRASGLVAVMELATQRFLGVVDAEASVRLAVPRHGTRILRLATWDGRSPMLLGTDGHLSGGAAEIAEWQVCEQEVCGRLDWAWKTPLRVAVGVPESAGTLRPVCFEIPAGTMLFRHPIGCAVAATADV